MDRTDVAKLLREGVARFNEWRAEHPFEAIEIGGWRGGWQDFRGADLSGADLHNCLFVYAHLGNANLTGANLSGAIFRKSNSLAGADLSGADLTDATVNYPDQGFYLRSQGAVLRGANLSRCVLAADFTEADFSDADLTEAHLGGSFVRATFARVRAYRAHFEGSDLQDTDFSNATLQEANFEGANLSRARFSGADLRRVRFSRKTLLQSANFDDTNFDGTDLRSWPLKGADLSGVRLRNVNLSGTDLRTTRMAGADLSNGDLSGAELNGTDLSNANLMGANLERATLIETNMENAILTDARIYGASVWDVRLSGAKTAQLVITPQTQSTVTVDNLEVAQFVYLLLNNQRIRDVIDTIGSKGVLILGRFTEERKLILDAIRSRLRELNYVPMLFDFDRPSQRDFTETIRILAGLSVFVIADITNPKSSPLELQALVPDYMVPFVPIIQEGESPFSMFRDLKQKHDEWVCDVLEYDSADNLIRALQSAVIDPALAMADHLRLKKAVELRTRHVRDYSTQAEPEQQPAREQQQQPE